MTKPRLTHLDHQGRASMVDVGHKVVTHREAIAEAILEMLPSTAALISGGKIPKGDVFSVARIAGILAAKRTHELIPLCHPLPLTSVEISFDWLTPSFVKTAANKKKKSSPALLHIQAIARCDGKTGVEMESLTAASLAGLTVYDMCKAVDREMTLGQVRLMKKSGGKSGTYERQLGIKSL